MKKLIIATALVAGVAMADEGNQSHVRLVRDLVAYTELAADAAKDCRIEIKVYDTVSRKGCDRFIATYDKYIDALKRVTNLTSNQLSAVTKAHPELDAAYSRYEGPLHEAKRYIFTYIEIKYPDKFKK